MHIKWFITNHCNFSVHRTYVLRISNVWLISTTQLFPSINIAQQEHLINTCIINQPILDMQNVRILKFVDKTYEDLHVKISITPETSRQALSDNGANINKDWLLITRWRKQKGWKQVSWHERNMFLSYSQFTTIFSTWNENTTAYPYDALKYIIAMCSSRCEAQ